MLMQFNGTRMQCAVAWTHLKPICMIQVLVNFCPLPSLACVRKHLICACRVDYHGASSASSSSHFFPEDNMPIAIKNGNDSHYVLVSEELQFQAVNSEGETCRLRRVGGRAKVQALLPLDRVSSSGG